MKLNQYLWVLLSALTLVSCSPSYQASTSLEGGAVPEQLAPLPDSKSPVDEEVSRKTQLIRTAELSLIVTSIDQSIQGASEIIQQQQGDVLRLQDYRPQNTRSVHQASMQLRVPQQRLEETLYLLVKLGTIQNQSLTAEDVSQQLVDLDARLRNLRKSEEMVLKIMERSGSVKDVLEASRELSNIRQSIETIDAQLKNLQNRVAYSTITLNLEAAVSTLPTSQPALGVRMGETWRNATYAMTQVTINLLRLTVWLLAFSPYFLLVAAGVFGYRWMKKQK